MAGFEYGTMDTGVTGGPNVKKPMDINEFMVRQSPPIPSGMVSSELTGEMPGGGNFASPSIAPPTTPTGTDWGGVMKNLAPILAQLGAATSAGAQNPIMAGVGGVVSSALQGQQMNERLKKMVNEAVAGKEGFPGSPVSEISAGSGLETLGLNPEQITGLYKTGMELREKERAFPLAVTQTLSSAYNAIASGDLASANAAAKNLEVQLAGMPENIRMAQTGKLIDIYKKIAEMSSTEATAAKTRAETPGIAPQAEATLAKTRAETVKTGAETGKTLWETGPGAQTRAERLKGVAPLEQTPFTTTVGQDIIVTTDTRTGKVSVKERPKASTAEMKATPLNYSLGMTGSTFYNELRNDIAAGLGMKPTDKAAADEFQSFLFTLGQMPPDQQPYAIRGKLSIANQQKFDQVLGIYMTGAVNGVQPEDLNTMVKAKLGQKVEAVVPPPVVPPPGKKVVNPKTGAWETPPATPTPTTKGTMLAPKNIIDAFTSQKKPAGIYPVTVNGVTTRYQWDGKGKAYAIK